MKTAHTYTLTMTEAAQSAPVSLCWVGTDAFRRINAIGGDPSSQGAALVGRHAS